MTYLRNTWYVAAKAEEASRAPLVRTLLDEPVLIYRTEAGEVVAMDNICPHRFASLNEGKLIGDVIQCPYHGLRFDRNGSCVAVPLGGEAPPHARLKSYPVVERYGFIWIWMGDAALADPAGIADFAYLQDGAMDWFDGYILAPGNYQLVVDNLLDLAHSEFLHPLLSSDGWSGRNQQRVEQADDTIWVWNVAEQDNIIPVMALLRPDMPKVGTTKHEERWTPPSLLRLSVEFYADGQEIIIPSAHFLTPETSRSTHYFIRGGHNVAGPTPQITAQITEGMRIGAMAAFETEDMPMIAAQQRYLGDADLMSRRPAIFRTDAGAVRVRRHLARLIRQECGAFEPVEVAAEAAA